MQDKRIAIIYDWMDSWGGVERMLLTLGQMYPRAHWYTSYVDYRKAAWINKIQSSKFKVQSSFIQQFPSFIRKSRILSLPFYPYAFESFDLREYDIVISVTSSFAKSLITHPGTKHVCILLTPTRWLWSHIKNYEWGITNYELMKSIKTFYVNRLKKWDYMAAQRPDSIISISQTVADRCLKYYDRKSEVVYPPFDVSYWASIAFQIKKTKILKQDLRIGGQVQDDKEGLLHFAGNDRGNYFLLVSRLEPYKKVDMAIAAFNKLKDHTLIIVGRGTQLSPLQKRARGNIHFLQQVSDVELARLYTHAQALIMPQEEDFGYVSLEAAYFGCPVIAYGKGGACETVVDGTTGMFIQKQSARALRYAVAHFKADKYNLGDSQRIIGKFSKQTFINKIKKIV